MSRYSRKDYVAVAKALRQNKPSIPVGVYERLVFDMANKLQTVSPDFDRARFFEACDVHVQLMVVDYGKRNSTK